MKLLTKTLPIWARQRALLGAESALRRHRLWGFTVDTLEILSDTVNSAFERKYPQRALKAVGARLHTATIDELTSDLFIACRSMNQRAYVDERLVYHLPKSMTMHDYLALSNGHALTPIDAWKTFSKTAMDTSVALRDLKSSEDLGDYEYYARRYESVFNETLEVFRLFLELVGFTCPPFNQTTS